MSTISDKKFQSSNYKPKEYDLDKIIEGKQKRYASVYEGRSPMPTFSNIARRIAREINKLSNEKHTFIVYDIVVHDPEKHWGRDYRFTARTVCKECEERFNYVARFDIDHANYGIEDETMWYHNKEIHKHSEAARIEDMNYGVEPLWMGKYKSKGRDAHWWLYSPFRAPSNHEPHEKHFTLWREVVGDDDIPTYFKRERVFQEGESWNQIRAIAYLYAYDQSGKTFEDNFEGHGKEAPIPGLDAVITDLVVRVNGVGGAKAIMEIDRFLGKIEAVKELKAQFLKDHT